MFQVEYLIWPLEGWRWLPVDDLDCECPCTFPALGEALAAAEYLSKLNSDTFYKVEESAFWWIYRDGCLYDCLNIANPLFRLQILDGEITGLPEWRTIPIRIYNLDIAYNLAQKASFECPEMYRVVHPFVPTIRFTFMDGQMLA